MKIKVLAEIVPQSLNWSLVILLLLLLWVS